MLAGVRLLNKKIQQKRMREWDSYDHFRASPSIKLSHCVRNKKMVLVVQKKDPHDDAGMCCKFMF